MAGDVHFQDRLVWIEDGLADKEEKNALELRGTGKYGAVRNPLRQTPARICLERGLLGFGQGRCTIDTLPFAMFLHGAIIEEGRLSWQGKRKVSMQMTE
jgi:hypothetical protein